MNKLLKPLALTAAVTGVMMSTQAMAYEAGDFIVRGGISQVDADASSSDVSVEALGGAVAGTGVDVDSATQLGLTLMHMHSGRVGIELLLATPFKHHVTATGGLTAYTDDVAEVEQLPPTLSVIYYLTEGSKFQPYVGVGINYTMFFSEESKIGGDADLDDSFGLALQVGADYQINDSWHVNASARWIDIETDATLTDTAFGAVTTTVDIDPMVYSVMLGYRF